MPQYAISWSDVASTQSNRRSLPIAALRSLGEAVHRASESRRCEGKEGSRFLSLTTECRCTFLNGASDLLTEECFANEDQDALRVSSGLANDPRTVRNSSKSGTTYEACVGPRPMWTVRAPFSDLSKRSSSVRSSPAAKMKSGSGYSASRRSSTSPLFAQTGLTSTIFSPLNALNSVSASIASNIDTSSLASHSPNYGSTLR